MFLRYNVFTFLWLLVILLLTLTPGSALPRTHLWEDLLSIDKLAHVLLFAVLTVLMIVGFSKQYKFELLRRKAIPAAALLALAYGLLIEVLQLLIPDRGPELLDFVANGIGCGLGIGIFYLIYKA
jgi:VanZ family protein